MDVRRLAQDLSSFGRGTDTSLVHMTPSEVLSLQSLAEQQGGSLSINPETGLPEAGFLKDLLPTIAGIGLGALFPGLSPLTVGLIAGAGNVALGDKRHSPLMRFGLGALGGYGGGSLAQGLAAGGGFGAAFNDPAKFAKGFAAYPGAPAWLSGTSGLGISGAAALAPAAMAYPESGGFPQSSARMAMTDEEYEEWLRRQQERYAMNRQPIDYGGTPSPFGRERLHFTPVSYRPNFLGGPSPASLYANQGGIVSLQSGGAVSYDEGDPYGEAGPGPEGYYPMPMPFPLPTRTRPRPDPDPPATYGSGNHLLPPGLAGISGERSIDRFTAPAQLDRALAPARLGQPIDRFTAPSQPAFRPYTPYVPSTSTGSEIDHGFVRPVPVPDPIPAPVPSSPPPANLLPRPDPGDDTDSSFSIFDDFINEEDDEDAPPTPTQAAIDMAQTEADAAQAAIDAAALDAETFITEPAMISAPPAPTPPLTVETTTPVTFGKNESAVSVGMFLDEMEDLGVDPVSGRAEEVIHDEFVMEPVFSQTAVDMARAGAALNPSATIDAAAQVAATAAPEPAPAPARDQATIDAAVQAAAEAQAAAQAHAAMIAEQNAMALQAALDQEAAEAAAAAAIEAEAAEEAAVGAPTGFAATTPTDAPIGYSYSGPEDEGDSGSGSGDEYSDEGSFTGDAPDEPDDPDDTGGWTRSGGLISLREGGLPRVDDTDSFSPAFGYFDPEDEDEDEGEATYNAEIFATQPPTINPSATVAPASTFGGMGDVIGRGVAYAKEQFNEENMPITAMKGLAALFAPTPVGAFLSLGIPALNALSDMFSEDEYSDYSGVGGHAGADDTSDNPDPAASDASSGMGEGIDESDPAGERAYGGLISLMGGGLVPDYAGGGLLIGRGDGMSDSIHGSIEGVRPARLADGEFVVPADVVAHIGNGSTNAGADQLYGMMDRVRKARTNSKRQSPEVNTRRMLPA